MKILQILFVLITYLFSFSQAQANGLEIALSSETAQFTVRADSSLIGWGGADLAFGVFFNDDDDIVGQISLMQSRQASEGAPLTFGIGMRGYVGRLDISSQNILALGIGGEIRYTIPGVMPMATYLQVNYAPKITSFSDTESLADLLLGFQIEILPQTIAFAGIRRLEVDTKTVKNFDVDDNNLHVGVRLTF
ncbi:MAG: hypothetical protein ACJASL_005117 [Paraglaciecola sp.]|jgi:hypothetical protein